MVTEIDLAFKEGVDRNGRYNSFEEFRKGIESDNVKELIKNNAFLACITFELETLQEYIIINYDDVVGNIENINLDTMKATINFKTHDTIAMQYYNGLEDPVLSFRKLGSVKYNEEKGYSEVYDIRIICGEIRERKSTCFYKEEVNE